jgi:hypothetical protein
MADTGDEAPDSTRRALLRRGLTLAVAAPALLGALKAAPAFADDGDDQGEDGDHQGEDHNHNDNGNSNPSNVDQRLQAVAQFGRFTSRLCRVSEAGTFPANNAGSDPLTLGLVRLLGNPNNGSSDQLAVSLRGAAANVSYEVKYVPANAGTGANRQSLGIIGPTNGSGFLNATTPSSLSGSKLVGTFVLVRSGGNEDQHDEYVTCFGF